MITGEKNNMNIKDIITLAKMGYSAEDVKNILATDVKEIENPPIEDPAPDESSEDNEKDVDYKALYESSVEEINTLKAENQKVTEDLKKAQKVNSKKDFSSDDDINKKSLDIWENFLKGR